MTRLSSGRRIRMLHQHKPMFKCANSRRKSRGSSLFSANLTKKWLHSSSLASNPSCTLSKIREQCISRTRWIRLEQLLKTSPCTHHRSRSHLSDSSSRSNSHLSNSLLNNSSLCKCSNSRDNLLSTSSKYHLLHPSQQTRRLSKKSP